MTKQELCISRMFNAPLSDVWEAFSTADGLAAWWGPTGFTTLVKTFDFIPNGTFHYGFKDPNGNIMWGIFVYKEITKPFRITFTNAFSNEQGDIVKAPAIPFGDHWPLEIYNEISFEDLGDSTKMTMLSYPVQPTTETTQTFISNIANMETGFAHTYNRLEAYLQAKSHS